MESIETLKARVVVMVESVDLERDEKGAEPSYDMDTGREAIRTTLPDNIRKLHALMDRRELTVQEYRRLLKDDAKQEASKN